MNNIINSDRIHIYILPQEPEFGASAYRGALISRGQVLDCELSAWDGWAFGDETKMVRVSQAGWNTIISHSSREYVESLGERILFQKAQNFATVNIQGIDLCDLPILVSSESSCFIKEFKVVIDLKINRMSQIADVQFHANSVFNARKTFTSDISQRLHKAAIRSAEGVLALGDEFAIGRGLSLPVELCSAAEPSSGLFTVSENLGGSRMSGSLLTVNHLGDLPVGTPLVRTIQ